MKLVDVNLLVYNIQKRLKNPVIRNWLFRIIDETPVLNAEDVVYCKDCVHCKKTLNPNTMNYKQICGYVGYNPVQSSEVSDYDFCSHGERKEE